ncbi:MAG: efflux RND transporter periplasmic adaptor subunit [Candidatus Didemnitutus sp.]|nr:efflux RND transporter periplasmic adaptor subunit [Candidatus Didemnitutus sp.]
MSPLIRSVAVGAVGAVLLLVGCGKPSAANTGSAPSARPAQPVEVVAVARRDLVESLSLVGSLAPNETAQIRAELSGQVRSVDFNEGESVRRGQVLLRIDDSELRAQLAQAESRHRLAELNLKRSEDLTQARSMSQAELDRVRSEFSSAEAELRLLRVRVDKMEIKAPFDGIVGARTISPGDYVTAATVITTLDDLSRLKLDFQVPERFVERVRPGSIFTVRAQTPAGEVREGGEVYFVSSVIDRATRSSQVKGFLKTETPGLKPGMFANIDIVLQVRRGALTVPEGSVLTTPGGTQVIAVREQGADKVAQFIPVTLGLREKGLVEVIPVKEGDLAEDQSVVASGVGALILFPGIKLEPRPLRPEFRIGA